MSRSAPRPQPTAALRTVAMLAVLVNPLLPACETTMPSVRLFNNVDLPTPARTHEPPTPDRFGHAGDREEFAISARSLIPIAFNREPNIKSSFHRFKAEEARYDFFYTSRDSLTPRVRVSNEASEVRADETVERTRAHSVEVGVEKRFFDTTELDVALGMSADAVDEAIGYGPFVAARLRYPLWASREKLERTSEEIFWRNQVDDAQLGYIQEVRNRLQSTLFRLFEVRELRDKIINIARWREDLEDVLQRVSTIADRETTADRARLETEIARVISATRDFTGLFDVRLERLKAQCGLPFHSLINIVDDPFNPFEGLTHDELFRLSVATDPEIATLRNAVRNAEVQLDLARRGRWDMALQLNGTSNLEGAGEAEGVSEWAVAVGFEVSVVDRRVTDSLIQQAEANISRFQQAIAARENAIYVDTYEPILRIDTLSTSREELFANLPRLQADYETALREYLSGNLNVDDLLTRRELFYNQEQETARIIFLINANVAELCAATGKFFELLDLDSGASAGPDQDRHPNPQTDDARGP